MIALLNHESKLKTQFQIQVTKKTLHPKGNLKKPDLATVGGGGQRWERSSAARGPYGLNDVQCGGLGGGLRSECADVGGGCGSGWGQPLRTALHTISKVYKTVFVNRILGD